MWSPVVEPRCGAPLWSPVVEPRCGAPLWSPVVEPRCVCVEHEDVAHGAAHSDAGRARDHENLHVNGENAESAWLAMVNPAISPNRLLHGGNSTREEEDVEVETASEIGCWSGLVAPVARRAWTQGRGPLRRRTSDDVTSRTEALVSWLPQEFSALRLQHGYEHT
ncbi:MAG: hypothetical protein ACJAYU_002037 [Bradymonadia bacterium]